MAKKIILSDGEYAVLCKVLRMNPPAQVPGLDGGELYYYRELLTKVLKEDRRFPDTDDYADYAEDRNLFAQACQETFVRKFDAELATDAEKQDG